MLSHVFTRKKTFKTYLTFTSSAFSHFILRGLLKSCFQLFGPILRIAVLKINSGFDMLCILVKSGLTGTL